MVFILLIFGLIFGSFINAWVWRLHEQLNKDGNPKKISKKKQKELSIATGRSMCPQCGHELAAKDLIPVLSWILLNGKCRYCRAPIGVQYPIVEAVTAVLFAVSYILWPVDFNESWVWLSFITWLVLLVGLIALFIYDAKWMLLPDKIVFKLYLVLFISFVFQVALGRPIESLLGIVTGILIGGGIFWVLFQVSNGRWIGGGDVKLGFLLGAMLGSGILAFLMLFFSSVFGMIWLIPLIMSKKVNNNSRIPFGPFLIAATIVVALWGQYVIDWYTTTLLVAS
ncbi:MAG: prepilin peptidase [Candidatus Saccharimonadales bacterium]